MKRGRVVNTENVDGFDLKVGALELIVRRIQEYRAKLTLLTTHPSGREASAPGKTYLFMLL